MGDCHISSTTPKIDNYPNNKHKFAQSHNTKSYMKCSPSKGTFYDCNTRQNAAEIVLQNECTSNYLWTLGK